MAERVMNSRSHFSITQENVAHVLAVLRVLPEWEGANAAELHRIFHHFGLDITESPEGNITDLFLASEHLSDTQTAVFRAIAPFVADGSHIMFVGEDAAQFAWVFRKNPATGIIEAHEEEVIPVLASEYRRLRGGPGDALS